MVSAVTAVSCCRSIAEAEVPVGSVLVVFYGVHLTADARAHEERIILANGASSERSARKRGIAFQIRSQFSGHSITYLGEIKQCQCMVNWKDFPDNSALFGLVLQ